MPWLSWLAVKAPGTVATDLIGMCRAGPRCRRGAGELGPCAVRAALAARTGDLGWLRAPCEAASAAAWGRIGKRIWPGAAG